MTAPRFNYIDIGLMRKMCHPIAVAIFDSDNDPIAQFDDHEIALLDAALANPRQTYDGKELYPTLAKKATILYYSLNKNHPFKNGNKRISTASLLVFLYINDYWLEGKKEEIEDYLVSMAKRVAADEGSANRETLLAEVEAWIEKYTVEKKPKE